MLELIGEIITKIGLYLIPFSFWGFIIIRPLFYFWQFHGIKLIKALWYVSAGIATFEGYAELDMILGFIAFIEAWDLFFQYLDKKREQKIEKSK
ncbi:MAG: hypothetical protein LPK26_04770 [Bacillaceae bacterium]|nr:hypothetical protein [Bacillaceae bacterium]